MILRFGELLIPTLKSRNDDAILFGAAVTVVFAPENPHTELEMLFDTRTPKLFITRDRGFVDVSIGKQT